MMPFIYLQARLACASDSISSLDYRCTLTVSWTDHQEKQLKSPSVSLPLCPLSLPAAWLHFTFESGFDHVVLSVKSYAKTNDSLHSSPGTAVRWLKKNLNFFLFFICTQIWRPVDQEMDWGQSFFFFGAHSSRLGLFMMNFHHDLGIVGKETLHKY